MSKRRTVLFSLWLVLSMCLPAWTPLKRPLQVSSLDPVRSGQHWKGALPQPPAVELSAPAAQGIKAKWLVMLYNDADDEILEKDMLMDLNDSELIGSSKDVTIVTQIDRYNGEGGYRGDGGWTSTRRYLVQQDNDLEHLKSKMIADLGELDTGDPQTLVDFAEWAIKNYPAERYALVMSNHGGGWTGFMSDNYPKKESIMSLAGFDAALGQIINDTGIEQFELVGFDACLMAQMEIVSALAPFAKYSVLSEEVVPGMGWAYDFFLKTLIKNPDMDGAKLAKAIVDGYIVEDIRVTDEKVRKEFVAEAFNLEGDYSAADVAEALSEDVTMSAIDLAAVPRLVGAVNDLSLVLTKVDQREVDKARTYAQSFQSVFGDKTPPAFIDLGHFIALLDKNIKNDALSESIKTVQDNLKKAVIFEKHGPKRPAATGLSIYFPVADLYKLTSAPGDATNYTASSDRFTAASLWPQFLAFHYAKKKIDPKMADLSVLAAAGAPSEQPPVEETVEPTEIPPPPEESETPEVTETPEAPPEEEVAITVSPLKISANEVGADGKITVSTDLTGVKNIAYVYIFTMYYSKEDDTFLAADMDYVFSENSKDLDGIYYPDWGEEDPVSLKVEWEPTIYYMSDGNEKNDQFALFEPQNYGVSDKDDVYAVNGIYTFKASGSRRGAVLEFSGDQKLKRVLVYATEDGRGTPRVILPKEGDSFLITEKWIDKEGNFVDREGGTMTFGKKTFEAVPYQAFPGKYIIGIMVEDLDGNIYDAYTDEITVKEK
ncbi:MAG: clostripain-related cysteine peptidase [Chloroflexota bacterium]